MEAKFSQSAVPAGGQKPGQAQRDTNAPAAGRQASPPDTGIDGPEALEERRQGMSPRHQRVSSLLVQLATTARSFLLYDPRNEAIHNFLDSLLEGFLTTLEDEQEIALSVQPFEIYFE